MNISRTPVGNLYKTSLTNIDLFPGSLPKKIIQAN